MFKLTYLILSASLLLLISQTTVADNRTQAKRIHDRLTGTPPSETILDQMAAELLVDTSGKTAADIAVADPAFYNVTLKNFVAPWTNEEQTVFTSLNDYTATVIGMIRDNVDFREILYGDILYTGADSLGLSNNYSNSDNNHYEELEALGPVIGDLSDNTKLVQTKQSLKTGLDETATAGVITTRAAAQAFFFLGTNRAMFRFTFLNHMCSDLEQIKDNSRSPDRVHQDVSRSPGGDSRIYLNSCVGCHAGMDGLLGAYAKYNFVTADPDGNVVQNPAQMEYSVNTVQPKFLINENNFKSGFITTDDSWINYWRNGPNSLLGWGSYSGLQLDEKGNATGFGAKTMGMELANSQAFAECQVNKAFQNICLRDPENYAADRNEFNNIVTNFKTEYNMKNVFRDVAAHCKGE